MGNARTVAASEIITSCLYELRDPSGTNYNRDGAYAELLGYINRCLEDIYQILVDKESELVRTGSGSLATVDGTQSYDLSANTMGDYMVSHRVWITGEDPMKMCEEEDLYEAINGEENSDNQRSKPEQYCIVGDYIWFETVPDDAYTVNFKYFPEFTPLSATTINMPYRNLFNNEVVEGVKFLAKHRNDRGVNIDAVLKDIFLARAMRIVRRRHRRDVRIIPGKR